MGLFMGRLSDVLFLKGAPDIQQPSRQRLPIPDLDTGPPVLCGNGCHKASRYM